MFIEGNQQAAMQAFMSGQIKVEGDMTKLMAMQGQRRRPRRRGRHAGQDPGDHRRRIERAGAALTTGERCGAPRGCPGALTGGRGRRMLATSREDVHKEPSMSERKPPGVSWETWIDRQVRAGMERGEFDDLPGHGKPIPDVDRPHDELWWVKQKLAREGVSFLPPTLAGPQGARRRAGGDRGVDLGGRGAPARRGHQRARSAAVNSQATAGPPSTLVPLPVEQIVDEWRAASGQRPS